MWGGRGGGRGWGGEVNNRGIVSAWQSKAMAAPKPWVRWAGESQGLVAPLRSQVLAFFCCFISLALGFAVLPEKWPGNIKALFFEVEPGFSFAVLATVLI